MDIRGKLNIIHGNYIKSDNEILNFKVISQDSYLLATSSKYTESVGQEKIYLQNILRREEDIEKNGKNFIDIANEKCYVQHYENFKMYIYDILKLNRFIYLQNKRTKIIKIELINKYARRKMHNKNIVDIIEELYEGDDKNINFHDNKQKELIKIINNRNILVHNKGIINETYLKKLQKKGIENNYKQDDCIIIDLENLIEKEMEVLENISEDIRTCMLKKI